MLPFSFSKGRTMLPLLCQVQQARRRTGAEGRLRLLRHRELSFLLPARATVPSEAFSPETIPSRKVPRRGRRNGHLLVMVHEGWLTRQERRSLGSCPVAEALVQVQVPGAGRWFMHLQWLVQPCLCTYRIDGLTPCPDSYKE